MLIFLITFGVFMLVIAAMAIGYIVKKKTISGSCG
ncbi:MAG: (Na+)-NQR maturation NqrM, partial [Aeromonas sp.]